MLTGLAVLALGALSETLRAPHHHHHHGGGYRRGYYYGPSYNWPVIEYADPIVVNTCSCPTPKKDIGTGCRGRCWCQDTVCLSRAAKIRAL